MLFSLGQCFSSKSSFNVNTSSSMFWRAHWCCKNSFELKHLMSRTFMLRLFGGWPVSCTDNSRNSTAMQNSACTGYICGQAMSYCILITERDAFKVHFCSIAGSSFSIPHWQYSVLFTEGIAFIAGVIAGELGLVLHAFSIVTKGQNPG